MPAHDQNAVRRFILDPADENAASVALVDGPTGDTTTRAELADGVLRAATGLASLGVQPEQRVLMVMADRPAFLEVFWGAMAIGAIPVPVSTMLTSADYRFLIADSRATAIVVSDLFVDQVLPATAEQPHLRHLMVEGGDVTAGVGAGVSAGARADGLGRDVLDYQTVRRGEAASSIFEADGEDVAFWLYTSGTTGFPKGALHRHVDMGFLTDAFARGVLDMTEHDRVYSVPKLFFAYGLGVSYFALGTGASHVLFDGRPAVEDVVSHLERHRPTLFFGVPTFLAQLLSSDTAADCMGSVRAAITGGEPLPSDIGRRSRDRFGLTVLDAIGSTEVAHIYICNRLDRQRTDATGWLVDGFEAEIRDVDGELVADGEPGELFIAGESVTPGYWRRTEQNRKVFHGRFYATGDTFVRNDDESYTYLGRGDDMIKAGGIWVSPTEVESAIVELPEVSLAAVVAATDDEGLLKPKAFVILEPEATASQDLVSKIQDHVRTTLAPFKYPRWVEFVDELPLTATGKVKRYLLRESNDGHAT